MNCGLHLLPHRLTDDGATLLSISSTKPGRLCLCPGICSASQSRMATTDTNRSAAVGSSRGMKERAGSEHCGGHLLGMFAANPWVADFMYQRGSRKEFRGEVVNC
eukprot:1156980-Pelagomonas_calceolata.AAC.12